MFPEFGIWNIEGTPPIIYTLQKTVQRRHSGRWNIVLCDGHVENLKTVALWDVRQEAIAHRWNRDHLPHKENWPALFRKSMP